ncbi:phospholipid scramblase 1-like [Symsagittifera roscoffensis]|uniref:phospholipid scramblase 1-like n=1 Tax=Symsagittifera roscoffensis TaxID=84072 RepID=UPI00307C96C8
MDSSAPPDRKEVPRSQQNDDSAMTQNVPSAPAAEQGGSSEQVVATPPQITAADAPPGTPPGLEYLALLDQVLVQQQVELVEAFVGFEGENKYAIKNVTGQQCYFAAEQSGCCSRQCCSNKRAFLIKIIDNTQREVIHVRRSFNCCAQSCCWLPCCGLCQHEVTVESPPGVPIGRIHNRCGVLRSSFGVLLDDEEIAYVKGPLCIDRGMCVCLDVKFTIYSDATGEEIGQIKKQFSGVIKETFTDADNFSLTFPKDLDVRVKAILLSMVFLIDFMYFETAAEKKVDVNVNT